MKSHSKSPTWELSSLSHGLHTDLVCLFVRSTVQGSHGNRAAYSGTRAPRAHPTWLWRCSATHFSVAFWELIVTFFIAWQTISFLLTINKWGEKEELLSSQSTILFCHLFWEDNNWHPNSTRGTGHFSLSSRKWMLQAICVGADRKVITATVLGKDNKGKMKSKNTHLHRGCRVSGDYPEKRGSRERKSFLWLKLK